MLQVNHQRPLFAVHVGPQGVIVAGKGGRVLWWPPHCDIDAAPLRMADARAIDLSSLLPSCSTDRNGRALAFLRGGAPCVRALAARDGALAFVTRGGELWEMPVQLAVPTAEAHTPPEAPLAAGSPSSPPPPQQQQPPPPPHQPPPPARLEVLAGSPRLVAQGHSAAGRGAAHGGGAGEACALCTHPRDPTRFASGGDDGSVRLWGLDRQRLLAMRLLPRGVSSLAYSTDGLHLAAGCDDGHVAVLHADSLEEVHSFCLATPLDLGAPPRSPGQRPPSPPPDEAGAGAGAGAEAAAAAAEGAVGMLSYSPDDSLLAAAGPRGTLHLLEVGESYRRLHCCVGHAAAVLHADWSEDGRYVQSVCARCELLYWDARTGERVRDPEAMRDVSWASWTCPVGWPVQGIYPKMSDGSDISSAHRSPDGRLLVTTDDFRKINLFRYPCGPINAACRSAAAHAAHVGLARFTCDGAHIVSMGAADLTVMVWAVPTHPT